MFRHPDKIRKSHPLYARGLKDKLALSLHDGELRIGSDAGMVLNAPLHKIFLASAIKDRMYLFVRRSGHESAFKVHVLVMPTRNIAAIMADKLTTLTCTLGFRRESMAMVSRASSVCSIDEVLAFGSPASSTQVSDAESSSDEEPSPNTTLTLRRSAFTPLVASAPASQRLSRDQPCGVCNKGSGDNWIALKTCEHQFHLPCVSQWRDEHNLCPVCSVPVSKSLFTLRYLGGCLTEVLPTDADLASTARDFAEAADMFVLSFSQLTTSDPHVTGTSICASK